MNKKISTFTNNKASLFPVFGMYKLKKSSLKRVILISLSCIFICNLAAQRPRLQRLPHIDQRILHFGFSVGAHSQDFSIKQSGFLGADNQKWYAEVPNISPGFNVGLLADLYLCPYLNLRLTPSMYFGSKVIEFKEENSDQTSRQEVKSNYLAFPLTLKYSAKRFNNYRPYIMAGASAVFDVSKKKKELIRTNVFDTYIEVGLGCDTYLSFFKLIPELKFCFGLSDILQHKRPDIDNPAELKYTQAIRSMHSRMVVLTFYFE